MPAPRAAPRRRGQPFAAQKAVAATDAAFTPPVGTSPEDGEWLEGLLVSPPTATAATPLAAAAGEGTEAAVMVPTSQATPPASPAATPDAAGISVVDVTDFIDLVDEGDSGEEQPFTPPAVRSQRTKHRRFMEPRDAAWCGHDVFFFLCFCVLVLHLVPNMRRDWFLCAIFVACDALDAFAVFVPLLVCV